MVARRNDNSPASKRGAGKKTSGHSGTRGRDGGPEPGTWRQPPAKRREKLVKMQTKAERVPRTSAKTRLTPAIAWVGGLGWQRAGVLVLLVALVIGFSQLLSLDLFRVSAATTEIRGNRRIEDWEIYLATGVEGNNIFTVRPNDVADRVARIPGMSAATVHVRLPNEIIVDAEEFLPLVAWQTPLGTRWLSEDGSAVPIAGAPPSLTLIDPAGAGVSENGGLSAKLLEDLVTLHEAQPDLHEIYYGELEGLYFRVPEGWTVYLGAEGDLERKLAILQSTRRRVADQKLRVKQLDLRFEEFPNLQLDETRPRED